jgi:hypothetical protein
MIKRVQSMVWPYVFGQSIVVAGAHIIRESTSPYDEKKTEKEKVRKGSLPYKHPPLVTYFS